MYINPYSVCLFYWQMLLYFAPIKIFPMKEIGQIVAAFEEASQLGLAVALATVVRVEGSAYRHEGARMLITENGTLTGAISGGCLEGDALRKALHVIAQQKAMLVTYDTSDEDEAQVGVQLGCNGIIHILIEPIDASQALHPIALLKQALTSAETLVLLTLYQPDNRLAKQPGTLALYQRRDQDAAPKTWQPLLQQAFDNRRPVTGQVQWQGSTYEALCATVSPSPTLVLFGAGNDVIPLTQLAAVMGWETQVFDGRPLLARAQRFPLAKRVSIAKPAEALLQLQLNEHTFVILMTHNYPYDLAVLALLIASDIPYLGILGPRKKFMRMLDDLRAQGIEPTEAQLKKVYAPVGLDTGGEGPEAIALAVLAEIQTIIGKREGGFLRLRDKPIYG